MSIDSETNQETSSELTEANLALIQREEKQDEVGNGNSKAPSTIIEDDKSSVLSKLDFNNQENLNLSEYYVSSDAETERMDEDSLQQQDSGHVHLADIISQDESKSNEKAHESIEAIDESETKDEEKSTKGGTEDNVPEEQDGEFIAGRQEHRNVLEKVEEETSENEAHIEGETKPNGAKKEDKDVDEEKVGETEEEEEEQEGEDGVAAEAEEEEEEEEEEQEREEEIKEEEELEPRDESQEKRIVEESAPMQAKRLIKDITDEPTYENEHGTLEPLFKKPKLPALVPEDDNEEDNDADEDEDEDEEDKKPEDTITTEKGKNIPDISPMEQETLRQDALKEIIEIEHQFAELRQRLYENKLTKLQTELQMCLEGSHPALQTYYQKIDSIRDYKLSRAYQTQKYELECIDKETKATRCFTHQDFYRKVSDLKHELLGETTQRWYDINKERREMDIVVPEVNYHVPVKIAGKTLSCITGYAAPAQQRYEGEPITEDLQYEGIKFRYKNNPVDKLEVIVDRMRFNNELSDLEGLKRYFGGFPGAPVLNGLKDSEIYEDLQNLQKNP